MASKKKSLADIIQAVRAAKKKASKASDKVRDSKVNKSESQKAITEFDSVEDWMMTMLLVAVMHANLDMNQSEVADTAKAFIKSLYLPRADHKWRKQINRIHRTGIRSAASRIRRELFKLL